MAIFSTNQARHLYVATAYKTPNVIASDAAGSIAVKGDTAKSHMYFEYMGKGGLLRSDLIDVKNIMYAKATKADKMARKLKAVTVTLKGEPVGGQDYILKVAFRQFAGMSDEDIYTKFGMVHATTGMSASDFYKELALSLVKNFSREATELVKFTLTDGEGTAVPVTATTKASDLAGTYKALVIGEVEQEWTLGIKPQVPVYFDVLPGTVTVGGDEVVWGEVEVAESAETVKNGKAIADLEYFCMGERGDQYRKINWPNNIDTKYMVDETKEYHVLDIHYAYVGSNEAVQKSEKDITIVCADMAELNKIISAVNTATGLAIATLA
jgi:hypothetical protein